MTADWWRLLLTQRPTRAARTKMMFTSVAATYQTQHSVRVIFFWTVRKYLNLCMEEREFCCTAMIVKKMLGQRWIFTGECLNIFSQCREGRLCSPKPFFCVSLYHVSEKAGQGNKPSADEHRSKKCNVFLSCCVTEGSLRLVNHHTLNKYEGRVEVLTRFGWISICDDNWSLRTAGVVCRQLGYGPVLGALTNAYFGEGNSSFVHGGFTCYGDEQHLVDCTWSVSTNVQCQHNEDAGVICSAPVSQPPEGKL